MAKGEFRGRVRRAAGPALFVACALYLGYHAVQGQRGLLAWLRIDDRVAQLRDDEAEIRAEREALEHRVSLLRPDNMDPDLLEERVADVLNLAPPGTLVIIDAGAGADSAPVSE